MRRHRIAIVTIAVAVGLAIAGPAMAKTLKIGTLSPLSGQYTTEGNDIANGVLAAVSLIKSQGGVPGFDKIEIIHMDTFCDPRQAEAVANKLLELQVAGVIGSYCNSSTIPASEVLAQKNVPMITPASRNEKVTERGLPYMFRMCGRDDDQAKTAVAFIKTQLNAQTIAIVNDTTFYSKRLADTMVTQCDALGISVLSHSYVKPGATDFSELLSRIKAASPDVIYMSLHNSTLGSLMTIQAKKIGLKAVIIAHDEVHHPKFIEMAKNEAEGVYLTSGYIDRESAPYKTFLGIYKPAYGKPGVHSAYAFDAAYALLTAIKKAGSTEPDQIKKQIMKMDFQGAAKRVKFSPSGDSGSDYVIWKVQSGQFLKYWCPAE